MKRPLRILFQILVPPILGLLPVYVMMTPDLISEIAYGHVKPGEHLAIILGAYLAAGIPSVVYTVVMEIAFSRFLSPASWRAVLLSTVLGLLAGLLIGAVLNSIDHGRDGESHVILTMLPTGMVVGFVMGILGKLL
jgi:hypothetical protein